MFPRYVKGGRYLFYRKNRKCRSSIFLRESLHVYANYLSSHIQNIHKATGTFHLKRKCRVFVGVLNKGSKFFTFSMLSTIQKF